MPERTHLRPLVLLGVQSLRGRVSFRIRLLRYMRNGVHEFLVLRERQARGMGCFNREMAKIFTELE